MISSAYRAFEEICILLIDLIRQFYTWPRCFRIVGADGLQAFVHCSSDMFGHNNEEDDAFMQAEPIFDIKVRAHKKTSFSRMAMNELACELYKMGLFAPENSKEAQLCLEMMEFEGKEEILRRVRENSEQSNIPLPSAALGGRMQ